MSGEYYCQFCGAWTNGWLHSCEGKHKSDWVEAEYNTMGWKPSPLIDTEGGPLMKPTPPEV